VSNVIGSFGELLECLEMGMFVEDDKSVDNPYKNFKPKTRCVSVEEILKECKQ